MNLMKALLRRWYIAVPLLLASAIGVVGAGKAIRPDYSAQGHIQMIPPIATDQTPNSGNHNPWTDLGVDALGQAAMVKVNNQSSVDQLVAQGYSRSFTITPTDAILLVETVAPTPAQATATTRKIMQEIEDDIVAEQAPYQLQPNRAFTTLELDDGSNVQVVTSKVKKGIAAAAGAGRRVTIGCTVAVDGLVRRRQRAAARRAAGTDADMAMAPPAPLSRDGFSPGVQVPAPSDSARDFVNSTVEFPRSTVSSSWEKDRGSGSR